MARALNSALEGEISVIPLSIDVEMSRYRLPHDRVSMNVVHEIESLSKIFPSSALP